MAWWQRSLEHMLALWAPPVCPGCERPAGANALALLCPVCRPPCTGLSLCERCGQILAGTPAWRLYPARECRVCRNTTWAFEQARSVAPYTQAWKRAVLKYKNQPQGLFGQQLARCLVRHITVYWPQRTWQGLVAVPGRWRSRTHAAEVLARHVSQRLHLPFIPVLYFTRRTRKQQGLSRRERWLNLRHAVGIRDENRVKGKSILLVDDVFTTGATGHACSQALCQAGATRVDFVALARATLRTGIHK